MFKQARLYRAAFDAALRLAYSYSRRTAPTDTTHDSMREYCLDVAREQVRRAAR